MNVSWSYFITSPLIMRKFDSERNGKGSKKSIIKLNEQVHYGCKKTTIKWNMWFRLLKEKTLMEICIEHYFSVLVIHIFWSN